MRGINERFVADLINGELSCFLRKVKENPDLCLEIRQDYINIYYKGGSALRITQKQCGYLYEFDEKYCLDEQTRVRVKAFASLDDYRDNFELLLSEMDNWFQVHPKSERALQQQLAKNNTEGFCILDIEYAGSYDLDGERKKVRPDMIAVHEGKLIIVENKNREGAMGGNAGIAKHYRDFCNIIRDTEAKKDLLESMKQIARNKQALGLPTAEISSDEIEILFLVLNHNPKSKMLRNQIVGIVKEYPAKIIFVDTAAGKIDYAKAEVLL